MSKPTNKDFPKFVVMIFTSSRAKLPKSFPFDRENEALEFLSDCRRNGCRGAIFKECEMVKPRKKYVGKKYITIFSSDTDNTYSAFPFQVYTHDGIRKIEFRPDLDGLVHNQQGPVVEIEEIGLAMEMAENRFYKPPRK